MRTRAEFTTQQVDDVQRSIQLGILTLNHPALVQRLRGTLAGQPPSVVVTWDQATWRSHVDANQGGQPVSVPAGVQGVDETTRRDNYAAMLVQLSEQAFPSPAAVEGLKGTATGDLATFLSAPPSDFDFRHTEITASYVAGVPGVTDAAALTKDLRAWQRRFRLCPDVGRAGAMQALSGKGIASSGDIVRMGRRRFVSALSGALGGDASADTVYRRARTVYGASMSLRLSHDRSMGMAFQPLTGDLATDPTSVTAISSYASLFASDDSCTCQDCTSILSPAAYFVQLLGWLDERGALDVLVSRRPDLASLSLSCQSTHTTLPYVDLVLELLENDADVLGGAPALSHDATTQPDDVLTVTPEYFNAAAYETLRADWRTPTLPFSLWHRRSRGFLDKLGVARSALMSAYQRRNTGGAEDPLDVDLGSEYLGITPTVRDVITGAVGTAQELWGYSASSTTWDTKLRVVSQLMRRGELTESDILDLLFLEITNPPGDELVWPPDSGCDLEAISLTGASADFESRIGRWSRFGRLTRAAGWSALQLDTVLRAFGATDIDATSFSLVAGVHRVCAELDVDVDEVAAWVGAMDMRLDRDTRSVPILPLYDRVYLDPTLLGPSETSLFALDSARTELVVASTTAPVLTQAHHSALQAALNIDSQELVDALSWLSEDLGAVVTLQLSTLSALYRRVSLSLALALSVSQLHDLVRLTNIDPFANPAATLDLADALASLHRSPWDVNRLVWLSAHDGALVDVPPIGDDWIAGTLGPLRDKLRGLDADWSDPTQVDEAHVLIEAALATALGVSEELMKKLANLPTSLLGQSFTDWRSVLARAAFVDTLSTADPTDPWSDLLRGNGQTNQSAVDQAFLLTDRLWKLATVLLDLELDVDLLVWWVSHHDGRVIAAPVALPDPLALPVQTESLTAAGPRALNLLQLSEAIFLGTRLAGEEPDLPTILTGIEAGDGAALSTLLATRTSRSESDWSTLTTDSTFGYFGSTATDMTEVHRMVDAAELASVAGVQTSVMDAWRLSDPDQAVSDDIVGVVRARLDTPSAWTIAVQPIRDTLREARRAALVAYLVSKRSSVEDADDLYAELLIDVQMQPCFKTSRLVQALASVQQCTQRWMLGLELATDGGPLGELDRDARQEWVWMKNYRVWEAAMKVFLFPENWLLPELRSSKSPIFEQLESALSRGQLDDDRIEQAVVSYVEQLQDIADLAIVAMLVHQDSDHDDLHLVGRTRGEPGLYYHRVWQDRLVWTAWRKIDASIQSDSLAMAMVNQRLFLFWLQFHEQSETDESGSSSVQYYELALSWSELRTETWSPVRTSQTRLSTIDDGGEEQDSSHLPQQRYALRVDPSLDPLGVEVWARWYDTSDSTQSSSRAHLWGSFSLDLCTMTVEVEVADGASSSGGEGTEDLRPKRSNSVHQAWRLKPAQTELRMYVGNVDSDEVYVGTGAERRTLLKDTPEPTLVLNPDQFGDFVLQAPFVVSSQSESFLGLPEANVTTGTLDWSTLSTGMDTDNADPSDLGKGTSRQSSYELSSYNTGSSDIHASGTFASRSTGSAPSSGTTRSNHQYSATGTEAQGADGGLSCDVQFVRLSHPFLCEIILAIRTGGVWGLYDPEDDEATGSSAPNTLARQQLHADDFESIFQPLGQNVASPYPEKKLSFAIDDPVGALPLGAILPCADACRRKASDWREV